MKLFKSFNLFLLLSLLISACSTMQDVKSARGRGLRQTINAPLIQVRQVIPEALAAEGLTLVSKDEPKGEYLIKRVSPWWKAGDDGELIAVYLAPGMDIQQESTEIEIVSMNAVKTQVWLQSSSKELIHRIQSLVH